MKTIAVAAAANPADERVGALLIEPQPAARARVLARLGGRIADYAALSKPRIVGLVVVMTTFGALMAAASLDVGLLAALAHVALGTALTGAGANALNQVWERRHDARMRRTQNRPLPAGRLSAAEARLVGTSLSATGLGYLAVQVNALATAFTAATLLTYVLIYTPLKRLTPWSTLVGALPGALPPLIGWSAVAGRIEPQAWTLFAIMFVWQLPHFYAIAWRYRLDYARAGYPMLPVLDPTGASTFRQIVATSVLLLAISVVPGVLGMANGLYVVSAAALGAAFLAFGIAVARLRSDAAARAHLIASIVYLPALFGTLLIDRV